MQDSDIDLLAINDGWDERLSPETFSIYSYKRIQEIWREGNPFAWHLSLEAKLVFASDNKDYLNSLGSPSSYNNCFHDCNKFYSLFREASLSINQNINGRVFELSTIFLSMRNIAICFSLGNKSYPVFSRNSVFQLKMDSLPLSPNIYRIFERARMLCTRGYGEVLTQNEINLAISNLDRINIWMNNILIKVKSYE